MRGGETVIKNRLKEYRELRGISQEELSKQTGLSRTTISKIENDEEVNVTIKTIAKIAEVLGAAPSEIFLL
ncbi:MAG: helix-turn-helix transcriptional regulator [Oscillospiraceae bacterium]|nr:helix-turn-helix transcriptional regulator [Oscillospiraceae bacterium]